MTTVIYVAMCIWSWFMFIWWIFLLWCVSALLFKLFKDWLRFVFYVITFRLPFFTAVYEMVKLDNAIADKKERFDLAKDMNDLHQKYSKKK